MSPRGRNGSDICAIYVHAGAGFHSYQNEQVHLEACNDAAKVAMALLKNGGSALDAVEMALKLMEDREITNAGYGSNLTAEGTVECDATIVDHFGRSGAVGACSHIKNPISAARLLLDCQNKPLPLQRVPPNFLVGQGATDFAYDHGMPIVPDDYLISATAKSRWLRWQNELEACRNEDLESMFDTIQGEEASMAETFSATVNPAMLLTPPSSLHEGNLRKDQDAPSDSLDLVQRETRPITGDGITKYHEHGIIDLARHDMKHSPNFRPRSSIDHGLLSWHERTGIIDRSASEPVSRAIRPPDSIGSNTKARIWRAQEHRLFKSDGGSDEMQNEPVGRRTKERAIDSIYDPEKEDDEDRITDTIGAIAVDCYGNIAAGSSSGGIGMKHRGRIGPAALVGIGTAVIPVDPLDPEQTSVAAVTSGTGEHIATTLAASTCANRIYFSDRKADNGITENVTEEEAIKSMIDKDFMDHPGVKHSHCEAAIGVMVVKKMKDGIYLFFCHNTDSFALASMTSEDKVPRCVMSRRPRHGTTAQGGRFSRHGR